MAPTIARLPKRETLRQSWRPFSSTMYRSDSVRALSCVTSRSTSPTASCWCWSGHRAAARARCCDLIAGLESPDEGRIRIGGDDVTAEPPQRRDLAMVFQHYALYPHMTVRDNLLFGLRTRHVPQAESATRVDGVARSLGIDALLDRRPAQLSGGERQRVALGRAVVREPRAFLLDEPLSNLDPRLRGSTRAELALLHRRLGTTMVYVTHDQEEAMTLGSRVAVMQEGALVQVAPPMQLYTAPANQFVGEFMGSPAMNLIECTASQRDGTAILTRGPLMVPAPSIPGTLPGLGAPGRPSAGHRRWRARRQRRLWPDRGRGIARKRVAAARGRRGHRASTDPRAGPR